jgi:hypothetical protein
MKIKEVVEALKEKGVSVEKLADGIEGISQKGFKTAFIGAGYQYDKSKRMWFYAGEGAEEEVLEKDIFDFVPANKRTNKRNNKGTNESKQVNEIVNKESTNQQKKQSSNNEKNVTTKEPLNITRKRYSFDLDSELMKKLKVHSVLQDVNIYELVEQAIKTLLKK